MTDAANNEASRLDAAPAAEQATVDTTAEAAQPSNSDSRGETSAEDACDHAPTQVATTNGSSPPPTASPADQDSATEPSTAAPVTTDIQLQETRSAVEMKDGTKVVDNAEPNTTEITPKKTPLDEFDAKLPEILKGVDHHEMWGVKLVTPVSSHIPTQIVIQKFLNANDGDITKAIDQLYGALKFRKDKKPLELLKKAFDANKFADLGAVTVYPAMDSRVPGVFTWNLYGNVNGKMEEVFVPLDDFMEYRIALQELGVQQLKLSDAIEPITAERDPYKIIQVHDYRNISFLRRPPSVKAATTEVIKQFSLAYPELLKEKFFVNVPAVMGWMYALIKVFIAERTARKFHPMANGADLAAEFHNSAIDEKQLPKEYGGEGGSGDGKMKDIPGLVSELKFK